MTSYLVTGATGSFGRAFVKRLLYPKMTDPVDLYAQRICIFSRGEHTQAQMRSDFRDDPFLRFFIGDVRDKDRLRRAMTGVDVVVHAAALKRIEVGAYNPIEMVRTNIDGAINVIEAAQDAGVGRVVALSTDKAYAPVSPYGASKALAEALFLAAQNTISADGPKFAVCRYGNVWCSNGSVVPKWRQLLASGAETVPVTDPECTRFFMTLDQAVDLVIDTIHTMQGGELRVPDLPAYRLGDLAEAMGAKIDVLGLPAWEKRHENMDDDHCSVDAPRMTVEDLRKALEAA